MDLRRRTFAALRHRNYRLFWFSQLVSLTGTWMHTVAQGWLVLELTDQPFWLGAVGAAARCRCSPSRSSAAWPRTAFPNARCSS